MQFTKYLIVRGLFIAAVLTFAVPAWAKKDTPAPTSTPAPTNTPVATSTPTPPTTAVPTNAPTEEPTEPEGKNPVCHKPGTPAEKTLYLPDSAIPGHLGHGDYLGVCGEPTSTPVPASTSIQAGGSTPAPTATMPPQATNTPTPPSTPTSVSTPTPVKTSTPANTATTAATNTPVPGATSTPTSAVTSAIPGGITPNVAAYAPVFRIDSMTDPERGAHVLGYVVGEPEITAGGFYGQDKVTLKQPCDSFLSSAGAYGGANVRPNCRISSAGSVRIHQSEEVYGSVSTLDQIETGSPYGGSVCADLDCNNPGATCEGSKCQVTGLDTYKSWYNYCPSDNGSVSVDADATLSTTGNDPGDNCWDTVTLGNKVVLTLASTGTPYFIKNFVIANNSEVKFKPNPANGVITLYVWTFDGDKFNSNQVINTDTGNVPCQLHLIYLGGNDLTMNGTAAMAARLEAPYALIDLKGNFEFYGAIRARELSSTGSSGLHYDESCGDQVVTGMRFRMRKEAQEYR